MLEVLNTTSTLFVTIFLGLICGVIGLFKRGEDHVLINYVFYIALPLSLFLHCAHTTWDIFNVPYISSYCLSMLITIILTYLISKKLKSTAPGRIIDTLSTSQIDGAYFTVPLFVVIFHSASLAVPLMLIQNVIFFTLSLIWLQLSIEAKSDGHSYIRFIFVRIYHVFSRNPIIMASVAGLVCAHFKLELPKTLESNIKFIGNTSSAVALFSLGLTCSFYMKSLQNRHQLIHICILSVLKLLIFPAIAALIGTFCFSLSHNLLLALVLLVASPAATHTYIIANKYNCDTDIATFNVVMTTILSFFTINLWLFFLR